VVVGDRRGGVAVRRWIALSAIVVASLLALAAACGGDGGDSGQTVDNGPVTFDIFLKNEVREGALVSFFTPDALTVSAGQEVTFNLSNEGTLPHNFRIAGPDGEYNTDDDSLVGPEILNPGDVFVQKWSAPAEAGTLIFRCDYHPESVGTITVE